MHHGQGGEDESAATHSASSSAVDRAVLEHHSGNHRACMMLAAL
jgi:hypothetical protein